MRSLPILLLLSLASVARAGDWVVGDVFVGVSNGRYQVRAPDGTLKDELWDGSVGTTTTGCAHRPDGTLYTTTWENNEVVVYSPADPHAIVRRFFTPGVTGTFIDDKNESLVFDAAGALLVGHAEGGYELHLCLDDGTPLEEHSLAIDRRGSDWIELAADQRTVWYTSEGARIMRYDLVSRTQLPDFAVLGTFARCFGLKLLPPGDGTGGLLVAAGGDVQRLDAAGNLVRVYDSAGMNDWFGLNLDPDGRTFWSGDVYSGRVFRFDIATGAEVTSIPTGSSFLGGICVLGEIRAALPCGNGKLDLGEECDDGNRVDGDGCSSDCLIEAPPCDPTAPIPEVDRLSLRVHKAGAARVDAEVAFDVAAIPAQAQRVNVYRGSIAAFDAPARYDHAKVAGSCGLTASPFVLAGAVAAGTPDTYWLAVYGCASTGADREGSYGTSFDGHASAERPTVAALGGTACP